MSAIYDQSEDVVDEITEQLSSISEMKESFSNDIKTVMNIIEQKGDILAAIKSLCMLIQSSHEKMNSLYEMSQHSLLKVIGIQKDLELNSKRREIFISENSDKIQTNETKNSCSSDLSKIWLRFSCQKELEELRKSKNLIGDSKILLKRMNIDVNEFGVLPISSAYF